MVPEDGFVGAGDLTTLVERKTTPGSSLVRTLKGLQAVGTPYHQSDPGYVSLQVSAEQREWRRRCIMLAAECHPGCDDLSVISRIAGTWIGKHSFR